MHNTLINLAKEQSTDIPSLITDALERTGGNVKQAARDLGVVHSVIYYHMKQHGISVKRCSKILINGERAS